MPDNIEDVNEVRALSREMAALVAEMRGLKEEIHQLRPLREWVIGQQALVDDRKRLEADREARLKALEEFRNDTNTKINRWLGGGAVLAVLWSMFGDVLKAKVFGN